MKHAPVVMNNILAIVKKAYLYFTGAILLPAETFLMHISNMYIGDDYSF